MVLVDVEWFAFDVVVVVFIVEGYEVVGVVIDVLLFESVVVLRDAVFERFGRVNVVCNNVGVGGVL